MHMTEKTLEQVVGERPFPEYADWWPVGSAFTAFMSDAIVSEWKALDPDSGALDPDSGALNPDSGALNPERGPGERRKVHPDGLWQAGQAGVGGSLRSTGRRNGAAVG